MLVDLVYRCSFRKKLTMFPDPIFINVTKCEIRIIERFNVR